MARATTSNPSPWLRSTRAKDNSEHGKSAPPAPTRARGSLAHPSRVMPDSFRGPLSTRASGSVSAPARMSRLQLAWVCLSVCCGWVGHVNGFAIARAGAGVRMRRRFGGAHSEAAALRSAAEQRFGEWDRRMGQRRAERVLLAGVMERRIGVFPVRQPECPPPRPK